jgi:hypothetical protein
VIGGTDVNTPEKPVPVVNSWTMNFWESADKGKLMIQRCQECGGYIFYPRMSCPFCFSDSIEWVESSGRGTVYSYTVVQSNAPSAFIADMPFVIAIVRLEEGVQMLTNIVGCSPDEVCCEMPVQVTFERLAEGVSLPKFSPISAADR